MVVAEVVGGAVGVAVVVGGANVVGATVVATAAAATVTVAMSAAVLHRNFMTRGALSGRRLRMEVPTGRRPGLFVLQRRVCLVAHHAVERPLVLPSQTSTLHGVL